jgi:coenzyme F420-0:L-glutamate ligase/coenzyme F420-1:gamma-L-glutamate ligase
LVTPQDDLADILISALTAAGMIPASGDVLVVAQKIVSKAEGRIVDLNAVTPSAKARELAEEVGKDPRLVEAILRESSEVVAHKPGVLVVAHKLGFVLANAGIDRSNVAPEAEAEPVLLLPVDPNASAAALKARLDGHFGIALAVVVSDSVGRAWRNGITGIALGAAGLPALRDLIGRTDLFGRRLEVTQTGFADEIAAAASLLMGQADEGLPTVLVRGLSWREPENDATALLRPKDEDLFR